VIGGRYALRTAIGHGGMGTVWRATDTLLRRDVAVKEVLLPHGMAPSDRDAMYQRTLREARAAAALQHPSVVQVYDVVTDGGRPWIVMELLQARSLAEMIVEDGPLAPRAVAKIGIALLGALEVAHAASVLHRDVKPANVLICGDGRCVLTDFGVARMPTDSNLTTPGMVLGSPHFISPERAVGATFGPPSDLFSLGVTLYTAVEGHPPFDKSDPFETMRAVVEESPAPAMRAGSLSGVLYGLLEKDPARRWDVETARAVLRDLLSGALASVAPAHETDPYAVVRQAPWRPATQQQPTPSGQIGGRAMLAPGESVTGAIRRLRSTDAPGPAAAPDQRAAAVDTVTAAQSPVAAAGAGDAAGPAPTAGGQAWIRPGRRPEPAADAPAHDAGRPGTAPARSGAGRPVGAGWDTGTATQPVTTAWSAAPQAPPAAAPQGGRSGHRRAATPGGAGTSSTTGRGAALLGGAAVAARRGAGRSLDRLRRAPARPRAAVAGGAALVLVLVGVAAYAAGGDEEPKRPAPPVAASSPPPAQPLIPTQEHVDAQRGVRVNVPAGWTKSAVSSYVDYTDPQDKGRRIRINVESATGTPRRFLEVAEDGLKKKPQVCAAPYQQVGLREDTPLAGRAGAELEYTCGQGGQMRHGVWRAVVVDGKSYHFYLTTPEPRFAESRVIFEELVRSFTLGA
jgi:hypothetical protein